MNGLKSLIHLNSFSARDLGLNILSVLFYPTRNQKCLQLYEPGNIYKIDNLWFGNNTKVKIENKTFQKKILMVLFQQYDFISWDLSFLTKFFLTRQSKYILCHGIYYLKSWKLLFDIPPELRIYSYCMYYTRKVLWL